MTLHHVTVSYPQPCARRASKLGMELFSMRGITRPFYYTIDAALDEAMAIRQRGASAPVVIADVWDNPGGGVAVSLDPPSAEL